MQTKDKINTLENKITEVIHSEEKKEKIMNSEPLGDAINVETYTL